MLAFKRMNVVSYILLDLVVACWIRKGYGVADFISIPSGSVVANFEGTINAPTLICNVTRDGIQIDTFWTIGNFRGVPGGQAFINLVSTQNIFLAEGSLLNELRVTNWTSEVDRVIVFCGTGGDPTQTNVTLRIYRPPILRDNFLVRIQEGDLDVPIDLHQEPAAFPEPSNFEWLIGGQPLRQNGITTTYSSVTFDSIVRTDSGNYTVNATNFLLDNANEPAGNDMGSFCLDVLYPPSFVTEGPTERYVLLGEPLSLVCGTGLDSNPQASVTWMAPGETTAIVDNDRHDLETGPEIVRLNFTNTILGDNGLWKCVVAVTSGRYIVSSGNLIFQDQANIGSITRDIQLTVIATPGAPSVPAVENIGATWARICWDAPMMADSPISRYQIIGHEVSGAGIVVENTTTNATFFNITGLLPATTYSFTVVAISEGGNVIATFSPESIAIQDTTGVTVPAIQCLDPVSANGNVLVQWSFIHTGGLNLTGVSAEYSFVDGASMDTQPVPISDLNARSVNVIGLVAGFVYTFRITAENSNGSSSVLCTPTQHLVGVPREPQFGNVESGSRIGEVVLEIKTVASGVDNENQNFRFIIIPVLGVNVLDPILYDKFDYTSGELESITVRNLEPGRSYTFSATAMNIFGTSAAANSPPVRAAETTVTLTPDSPASGNPPAMQGNNIDAIIGGVVGVLLSMVIIIIIVIVAISLYLRYNRDHSKSTSNVKIEVPIYDEPDNFRRNTANASDIELKDCPAYDKVQKETHIELEQCPAYGELRSRS